MTIVDFLLARIAEDEEKASLVLVQSVDTSSGVPQIKHTAIRERVLAECEAKRRIVEDAENFIPTEGSMAEAALLALATIYADRPGYDERWRP